MTCIVGIVDDGRIVLAGDSAGCTDTALIEVRDDPKVFTREQYVIGYTISYRMGQILRYGVELPEPPAQVDLSFMVRSIIPSIREAFETHGFLKTFTRTDSGWSEHGQAWGGRFLVGVHGQLFIIDHDFQVGMPHRPYLAVGSGAQVAYGSLYSSAHLEPEERATLALSAAAEHTKCVRGPFVTVTR